jgi:hypothetical protein
VLNNVSYLTIDQIILIFAIVTTNLMYKKIFITNLLMVLCLLSKAQSAPAATGSTDPNAPIMTFETMEHDFGTFEQDGNGTYFFLFTNTGKEPLIIKEAHGSCGCTVPKWPHGPVGPGQKDTIKVTYDTHRVGPFHKTVTITSNAKTSPLVLTINGKTTAKPPVPAFPTDPGNNTSGAPFSNNWDNQ